jgi:hypothetical protein
MDSELTDMEAQVAEKTNSNKKKKKKSAEDSDASSNDISFVL